MQPIEDVVEHPIQWNLAHIAALGLTQIGCEVHGELFFHYFDRDLAHGDTLSGQGRLTDGCPHHAHGTLLCQPRANLKIYSLTKSLNEFRNTSTACHGNSRLRVAHIADDSLIPIVGVAL